MSAGSKSVVRSRFTKVPVETRLSAHGYTLASNIPLQGTSSIYETIGPYGSHVFVDMNSRKEFDNCDESLSSQHVDGAEECCEHLTGYVSHHTSHTVVKHIGKKVHKIPVKHNPLIRTVPLLLIEEIEADPNGSAINADKVSSMLSTRMIVNVCESMTRYDDIHHEATSSASKYFHAQSPILDDAVEQARTARELMIAEPTAHEHKLILANALNTLEKLHTHAIAIQAHCDRMAESSKAFKTMCDDLEM